MENFKVWQRNYVTKEVINKENKITVYGNRTKVNKFNSTKFGTPYTCEVTENEFLVFMDGEFKWINIKAFVPVGYVPDEEVLCLK